MSDLAETFTAQGLEPVAIRDAKDPEWARNPWYRRAEWARAHLGNPDFIYRAEFYLIDTAFAVVSRFIPDSDGRKWARDGTPVTETATVLLTELPPEYLLRPS